MIKKLSRLLFSRNFRFYLLGLFMLSVFVAFVRSIITDPPVGATHEQMKMIKQDMEKLLSVKNAIVLYSTETKKSGVASLLMIVAQEGWSMTPSPSDERFLTDIGWKKVMSSKSIFCKENIKLSFESSTYKNKNAMSVVMRYDKDTVKECSILALGKPSAVSQLADRQ